MILQADYQTGVWHGSAEKFAALYRVPARTARYNINSLHDKGYIKRFNVKGKHGNYPVLINKFCCRDTAGREVYVNATLSTNWKHPVYDKLDTLPGGCREVAAVQEVRTNNKEKASAPTPRGYNNPRKLSARQMEAMMEIQLGENKVKDGYIEFARLRDSGALARPLSWAEWAKMNADQRRAAMKAA